ncbi:ATP-binding protein [Streptomyces sp. NPDC057654]|uniref:ATP-binding protein n=1 Tax=Streptomyces sp. NPDC057654 TaxID=3346196 RepID=UPI00369ECE76
MSSALITEPTQSYGLSAPNSPTSPKFCRDTVAAVLFANDRPGLVDVAKLLVSEAVTNINLHTATPTIRIETTVSRDSVLVTVHDDDPDSRPRLREARPDEESGRGLLLVQELASAWGITWTGGLQPSGKRVWFELRDPA